MQFFYKVLKDHVLANGRIGPGEAKWLGEVLLEDGRVEDEERKFLREFKGQASEVAPQFEELYKECRKMPQDQHTSR